MEEKDLAMQATVEPAQTDVESLVKELLEKGLQTEEITAELQKMYEEQKLSEEELKKGVALAEQMDKELASKQFGINIM